MLTLRGALVGAATTGSIYRASALETMRCGVRALLAWSGAEVMVSEPKSFADAIDGFDCGLSAMGEIGEIRSEPMSPEVVDFGVEPMPIFCNGRGFEAAACTSDAVPFGADVV